MSLLAGTGSSRWWPFNAAGSTLKQKSRKVINSYRQYIIALGLEQYHRGKDLSGSNISRTFARVATRVPGAYCYAIFHPNIMMTRLLSNRRISLRLICYESSNPPLQCFGGKPFPLVFVGNHYFTVGMILGTWCWKSQSFISKLTQLFKHAKIR